MRGLGLESFCCTQVGSAEQYWMKVGTQTIAESWHYKLWSLNAFCDMSIIIMKGEEYKPFP